MTPELAATIALMGLIAYGCRAAGFWAMRYVNLTPRLQAALGAVPIATMVAILAPLAMTGGRAELAALITAVVAMKWLGNDLAAAAIALGVLFLAQAAGL